MGADGLDFADLAVSIAVEAEQAQALTEQVEALDERIAGGCQIFCVRDRSI